MSNLTVSIWEVCDPKELPKSLEMTMAMKAILKSRKAQITPRFLDFSNEILTLTANNLEKFKDDLDFLREMSELPKHLSKNESPVLDLSLPQKEFTFFLTEVIKIANHYNVVILLEDLWFAFLPQDVIYPVDAREKWQQINSETDATPFDTIENFPQSNALIKKYFIEQLSPQLTDLGFVLSTHEPDIVFTHPQHNCQLNIGLDGECGMYEIFADLVFHQATEQIAQLFNQPFTGSELTVSVNQLINWQLPVDYRSIRSFDDVTRFMSGFNKDIVPLLKQLN
ncbi:MAG: hypothetical protein IPI79_02455 [Moraxellaceae bacterium]|nr:hypothetical protein [Moraxellaceae bacterium]MBL0230691.1 hypothetical protein [Moraxellaceae bacterium]MCC6374189.1 hypothetical protein [Moraxellaceae bacterium]